MESLKEFIESTIDFENSDNIANTLENAVNQLHSECIKGNNSMFNMPLNLRFKDAVQGLPSYINIPFYNGDIENLMYALGYERTDDIVDRYWFLVGDILATEFRLSNKLINI